MIYDRPIEIARLDENARALDRRLTVESTHYCAELEVYRSTYFQWQQNGETIDRMVQLPAFGEIRAAMFAILDDAVYRVVQARQSNDGGCKVWILTLRREEARYEVYRS